MSMTRKEFVGAVLTGAAALALVGACGDDGGGTADAAAGNPDAASGGPDAAPRAAPAGLVGETASSKNPR